MECCIPALPSETGNEFLIFRWGATGYSARPGGPAAPFIHREKEEPVPVVEIEKTAQLLNIELDNFWAFADGCQVNAAPSEPPAENKKPSKP